MNIKRSVYRYIVKQNSKERKVVLKNEKILINDKMK